MDRLQGQGADLTVCIDAEGDHSSLISTSADWVHSYLESVLLGGEGPAPCVGVEALGADAKCGVPIPNSLAAGQARLELVLRDRAGNRKTVRRSLKIPRL